MKIIYSLLAASVATGAAGGLSAGVLALPKGPLRDAADRFVAAPGRLAMDKVETKEVKKLRKKARKRLEAGAEKLEEAAETLLDSGAGDKAEEAAEKLKEAAEDAGAEGLVEGAEDAKDRLEELSHYYNVGVWSLVSFAFCFVGTLLMGVSSAKAALSLGFRVTIFLVFLQAAFVTGGVLVWEHMKG